MNTKITIETAFSEGWAIFKAHMGSAIAAFLLAYLIGSLTCGICIPALQCGAFMLIDNWLTKRDQAAGASSIFNGFKVFLVSLCASLLLSVGIGVLSCILTIIPILGILLCIALAFVSGPILFWVLMIVANQKISCLKAIGLVLDATVHGKFWMPILVGILANIVGAVGSLVCGIGMLFTMPLAYCIYAAAYRQAFPVEEVEALDE